MKILRIIPSMDPKQGGPCQGIRNAIPELQKLEVYNEVVCLDDENSEYLGQDPFPIHTLGEGKTPWKYNKRLIPWLLGQFHRFDAVIIHGLWLYPSTAGIKAMLAHRKKNGESPKVFVMPHGMLDPYFQKAKERRMKALRNDVYWKIFENKVVNQADGIFFTCEEELLLARTTFPNYRPKKEINVGYGIQPPPAYTANMKKAFAAKVPKWNGKPYLLFLSRIHPKKGVDLLIKAYLKLEKELGNIPQLIIAGPGWDNSYGLAMQQLATASSNIMFPGMLSGDAKWGAFYESEVFVLPSHQENFGIAVVESLACGKPVLISDKVNIWREIKEGSGGIVQPDTFLGTENLLREWLQLAAKQKQDFANSAIGVYKKLYSIKMAAQAFSSSLLNN